MAEAARGVQDEPWPKRPRVAPAREADAAAQAELRRSEVHQLADMFEQTVGGGIALLWPLPAPVSSTAPPRLFRILPMT